MRGGAIFHPSAGAGSKGTYSSLYLKHGCCLSLLASRLEWATKIIRPLLDKVALCGAPGSTRSDWVTKII